MIRGLSGGVDSSVVAALLARAIGEQVACIFVDKDDPATRRVWWQTIHTRNRW